MQEDRPKEHEEEFRIKSEKCGDPDCENCGKDPEYIVGTPEQVLEYIHNKSMDRDDLLLTLINDQAIHIIALYKRIEALENPLMGFNGGALN